MGGAQTTINLSYRNGGGCSWATAGRRLRNVKGKGEDGGTVTVMGEEAMPPNPQQYFRIIPFWHTHMSYTTCIGIQKPTTIFMDYSILE
jgi:hypothetical protein